MTAADDLLDYVITLSRFSPTTAFILKHGRVMNVISPLHATVERGALGDCYMNAGQLAWGTNVQYVEGYAVPASVAFPMMHAWLLDPEGRVIDPTWEDGAAYFGVVIPNEAYSQCLMRTGYWGVFDNLWLAPELIKVLEKSLEVTS
jgi:hypothetical protein